MIHRDSGLPEPWVCRYLLTKLRQDSINVQTHAVDALCLFNEWCVIDDIDLVSRFDTGELFSEMEIENLSEFLRTSKKPFNVINRIKVGRVVVGNTHKERFKRVERFVRWRMSHVLPSIADSSRAEKVSENLSRFKRASKELTKGSKQKQREALTDDELQFLMKVIRPDDPRNPFTPETRQRNFALVLMIAELGIRQGEPLVLKSEHINISGRSPTIRIEPNPNDPEEFRKDPPLVKTNGRELPMSPLLASTVDKYIMNFRTAVPGYKRNPFIFLAIRTGDAMSLDAVYEIFRILRRRFPDSLPPDLSAHKLRHTWNTRFRRLASEYGWESAFRRVINNYIMGWSKTSKQDTRYGHTEIAREASRILQALQGQISQLGVTA